MPARRIALAQFGAGLGEVEANLVRMLGFLAARRPSPPTSCASRSSALSGYLLERRRLRRRACSRPSSAAEATLAAAAAAAGVALVYGAPGRRGADARERGRPRRPGRPAHRLREDPHGRARAAGVRARTSYASAGDGTFGLACCYDLAFPEPARMLALQGARVLLVPMAWEVRRSFVLERWQRRARSRTSPTWCA